MDYHFFRCPGRRAIFWRSWIWRRSVSLHFSQNPLNLTSTVEYVLGMIKILACAGFIIFGIVVDCGGVPTDHRGYIGAQLVSIIFQQK
jgi:amino acid permease